MHILITLGVRRELRIVNQLLTAGDLAELGEQFVVSGRDDDPTVLGAVRFERRDRRMLESERTRHLAGRGIFGDGVFEDGDLAVEHGDIDKLADAGRLALIPVSYTHLRAHETGRNLVCRLLLEKKKKKKKKT